MTIGDLVLLEGDVAPVMRRLAAEGIQVTALRTHGALARRARLPSRSARTPPGAAGARVSTDRAGRRTSARGSCRAGFSARSVARADAAAQSSNRTAGAPRGSAAPVEGKAGRSRSQPDQGQTEKGPKLTEVGKRGARQSN